MRVRILSVFLLISTSSLLFSSVICDPNHHHNHNDFPWQNILSSLGIGIEKQTEPSGDVTVGGKDHYTSESSVDIVKSETRDESEIPVVAQSEHYASESTMGILKSETKEESEMPNVTQNVVFSNKCIDDLGCFYTGPPFFNPLVRPLSVAPADNVKPKMMLFTKKNPRSPYILQATETSMRNSQFDKTAGTKFLVHGFKFKLVPTDALYKIKDELFKHSNYNVIIVDWGCCNGGGYEQAVANTRVVGAIIAKYIKLLMKVFGVPAQSFHIIGHSLGAHIAGYAGERIPGLGRITGLDPAGPFFQGADKSVRLDPSDATFVDTIHTNGASSMLNGLGMTDAIGHMDFFPNGGSKQPGCDNATGDEAPPKDPTAIFGKHKCHHMRANRYFLASVNPGCRFQAVQCNSYADYQSGKCGRSALTSPMGLYAAKKPRLAAPAKFFLKTSVAPPYCMG